MKLALTKTGPAYRYKDRDAVWDIKVANAGDVPLTGVMVRDLLPPQLTFASAEAGGQLENGQVVWNVGTLQPREEKLVRVTTHCTDLSPRVVNVATASADSGLQARAEAPIEIRGLAAFRMELRDLNDPVEVGNKTSYIMTVTNQGSLPGSQVVVTAEVPVEMRIVDVKGPSAHHLDGQKVTFEPVDSVPAGAQLDYSIEVQALRPGDVRFRAWLSSATLTTPVLEEESTNIIVAPPGPRPPAPMPPGPAPMPIGPSFAPPPAPGAGISPGVVPASVPIATAGGEPPIAPPDLSAPPPLFPGQ